MLWYGINVKPIVTVLFVRVFDKAGNFAVLIFCTATVTTNQYISMQKYDSIHFKFSAELNKLTPSFLKQLKIQKLKNSKIATTNQRMKKLRRASFRVSGSTR